MKKKKFWRTYGIPAIFTLGALYLWLEFGANAPLWWPLVMAVILVGHYVAYFKKQEAKTSPAMKLQKEKENIWD